jgi:outer membrane protein OmpA-like peptidoglycan-associated protein
MAPAMELSARDESAQSTPIVDSVGATTTELQTLRKLLLGAEYQELLQLKQQLENPNQYSLSISKIVSEAIAIRAQQDTSIAQALGPTIEGAIDQSIKSNPKALADSLYPVMGPAIRKSIFETISAMLEGFNQAVEQSLSPRSLGWRIDAWRTGKAYSEIVFLKTLVYRVEQVFLIHRDTGLVLQHLESSDIISKDPDLVSAMLTAIQDFIADSFQTSGEDQLSTLQLGDLRILVEQGPSAVIATAVRGNVTPDYRLRLSETLEQCHQQYGQEFQNYEGDNTVFVKLPELMRPCLSSLKQDDVEALPKKVPWIAIVALLMITVLSAFWWYQGNLRHTQWQQWIERLNATPGVVVTGSDLSADPVLIRGLKDPLATLPAADSAALDAQYRWSTFYSTDQAIQYQRIEQLLTPSENTTLAFDDGVLSVSGVAQYDWYQTFKRAPLALVGVSQKVTKSLRVEESNQIFIDRYLSDLASVSVDFEVGRSAFDEAKIPKLYYLANRVRQLQDVLLPERQKLKIRITGSTDSLGTDAENKKLGLARADNVARYLSQQGVILTNLKTAFHLSQVGKSDEQARRITVEAWVENTELEAINRVLSSQSGDTMSGLEL